MIPEVVEVLEGECGDLGCDKQDERGEEEDHSMGDEVVVAELHVLEFDGLFEIWELCRGGGL